MELVIILCKEVADEAAAVAAIALVKEKLIDVPDVKMRASTTQRYDTDS